MGGVAQSSREQELLSTAEIAERFCVSERTIRNRFARLEIDPIAFKVNDQGKRTPLYAYNQEKLEKAFSNLGEWRLNMNEQEEMLSLQEIANRRGVSERTIRRQLAAMDIDPTEFKVNAQGSRTPLYPYSQVKYDKALSHLEDVSLASRMSDAGKLKWLTGEGLYQVLNGPAGSELGACFDFFNALYPGFSDILIEYRDAEAHERAVAIQNQRRIMIAYDQLIEKAPDSCLDSGQIARKYATTAETWLTRFSNITHKAY